MAGQGAAAAQLGIGGRQLRGKLFDRRPQRRLGRSRGQRLLGQPAGDVGKAVAAGGHRAQPGQLALGPFDLLAAFASEPLGAGVFLADFGDLGVHRLGGGELRAVALPLHPVGEVALLLGLRDRRPLAGFAPLRAGGDRLDRALRDQPPLARQRCGAEQQGGDGLGVEAAQIDRERVLTGAAQRRGGHVPLVGPLPAVHRDQLAPVPIRLRVVRHIDHRQMQQPHAGFEHRRQAVELERADMLGDRFVLLERNDNQNVFRRAPRQRRAGICGQSSKCSSVFEQ